MTRILHYINVIGRASCGGCSEQLGAGHRVTPGALVDVNCAQQRGSFSTSALADGFCCRMTPVHCRVKCRLYINVVCEQCDGEANEWTRWQDKMVVEASQIILGLLPGNKHEDAVIITLLIILNAFCTNFCAIKQSRKLFVGERCSKSNMNKSNYKRLPPINATCVYDFF